MYKIHDYSDFIVNPSALIAEVLQKLTLNKGRTVFIVDDFNLLLGSVTDGDLRRCLIRNKNINLNEISVLDIANSQPYVLKINSVLELPKNIDVDLIPVLNADEKLLFLLSKTKPDFKLGVFNINEKSPALIIAEIGNNHQGSVELARKLIYAAKQAGADIVKFQHRNLVELFSSDYDSFDLGSQYVRDLVERFQLKRQDLFTCFDYCKEIEIDFTCTPFDCSALADLEEYGLPFYKIASADFLNDGLISAVIKTNKPFIISTGMASDFDIQLQIKKILDKTEKFVPLHCNSTYPAPVKDLQMNFMNKIEGFGNGYVGYSGHEQGIAIAIACATRGAKVIEKHFTLDKSLEGNDHKVSLLPGEFKLMVEGIRTVELAFSDEGSDRILSQGEIANKLALGKGIYFNCDLDVGEQCYAEMFSAKSPVLGLPIENLNDLVGRRLMVSVKAGEPVKRDHFYEPESFDNPVERLNFYIPVRHADCDELIDALGANMVEFHLSYSDLSLNLNELPLSQIAKYSVHAPELFENDQILDISSTEDKVWTESVKNLRRVVDFTMKLNKAANINEPVNLVVNVGGASDIELALNHKEKSELYDNVNRGLHEALGSAGEEINVCIQTMPPYPWHFGGRRFHNLFLEPEEIMNFCKKNGWRICLDTSHSMMACNYFSMDFQTYLSTVYEYVDHIHIADCVGVDGEGVVTGKGDFNFAKFKTYYDKNFKNVPLVIEEWQGHMNGGLGFKKAAKYLLSLGYLR